ncbi:hypothetical protein NCG97_02420 [Streptomyces lydicamycinicus]|uniref:hypothetical protein n=1 Tax=Streptomyces lydicamycinicus TaxID=1546107 RepID=UPI002034D4AF|nr:hypothetical protein [Streptomyces lydicamycinicus]URZ99788.1 hypothetical protein NCG97_02420 [Streptomyces lydicamycinicus]
MAIALLARIGNGHSRFRGDLLSELIRDAYDEMAQATLGPGVPRRAWPPGAARVGARWAVVDHCWADSRGGIQW